MTVREVLELPPVFSVPLSFRACGLGRSTGYELLKRGEFPIPVRRIGSRYKVRRCDLLAYLGVADTETQASTESAA